MESKRFLTSWKKGIAHKQDDDQGRCLAFEISKFYVSSSVYKLQQVWSAEDKK